MCLLNALNIMALLWPVPGLVHSGAGLILFYMDLRACSLSSGSVA